MEKKTNKLINDLKDAYRKWKSAAYFDSFLTIDAKRLAFFELKENIRENDEFFNNFANELLDEEKRNRLFRDLCGEIKVRCFPKANSQNEEETAERERILNNLPQNSTSIEKTQYMIDLPVKAHILGVLWVMKFGCLLDIQLDDHCYGNRIRKTISSGNMEGPTPYLYYPYFKKYESWRDEALAVVENLLDLESNVAMVSLDIKGFYYNCRVNFTKLRDAIEKASLLNGDSHRLEKYFFLNQFVEEVFVHYSSLFWLEKDLHEAEDTNPLIPIGFLPALVISNWYLSEFDQAVKQKIKPIYYGRYVDDILLVFSIKDNSFVNKGKTAFFRELLKNFKEIIFEDKSSSRYRNKERIFKISSQYLNGAKHLLSLSNNKIKIFYFSPLHSRELIETFKRTIAQQSSAFLYLHENDKDVFMDYASNIWKIHYSDTQNKIRSVENLSVDKFLLSRWLSFLVNFSGAISPEDIEKINKILFESLAGSGYLRNFNLWDKYLTFFFNHSQYTEIKSFCVTLKEKIEEISIDNVRLTKNGFSLITSGENDAIKHTLWEHFSSILQKVFSMRNDEGTRVLINELILLLGLDNFPLFEKEFKEAYLLSYLFNTQITLWPLLDFTGKVNKDYDLLSNDSKVIYPPSMRWDHLIYFPRYIHLHEIQLFYWGYPHQKNIVRKKEKNYDTIWDAFWKVNYGKILYANKVMKEVELIKRKSFKLQVGDQNNDNGQIRIGIANVKVRAEIFEANLEGASSFSTLTRNVAADIINSAIENRVDLLVMPECYIDYRWINKLIRISKDHQIGMVFGLEHIIKNKIVYNYLVTLLPFKLGDFNNCIFDIRLKNHYAPFEIQKIKASHYGIPKSHNASYTMYSWKGMSFAPYSCFEIACIEDRALFKSLIDALVIVEWNKDIEYFSSIIESLSRDLHCYCIQVNSSEYGDNRITQPARYFMKDIVRAKGGNNSYLIVDTIDINRLRDFQKLDYKMQQDQEKNTGKYKPTPPGFNPEEVNKR